MENITLSESNKKALHNKITKAINDIDDETIKDMVESPIREVIRNMFIERGLIKDKVNYNLER